MTPLWITKPTILYEKKYIFEVLPGRHFDFNRKLNSLLRLSIYYSILTYLFDSKKTNIFYIPFIVSIITFILSNRYRETFITNLKSESMNHKNYNKETIQELKEDCKIPTKNNPFMNPEIYDYNTKSMDKSSCSSYNNKGIQKYSNDIFNKDLYRDINDIFGRNNSQRQFYTVPGNSIPNKQGDFAKWLYSTPKTCKEGNGLQCAANMFGVNKGPIDN
tara:strand:- start:4651 stop:5304 length:654 start_codon:yes stop_codon:yes gene_type:complete